MNNFNEYNKQVGWHQGDILLTQFAMFLEIHYGKENLLFRILGDDFIILSKELLQLKHEDIEIFFHQTNINFECLTIDIEIKNIKQLTDLEFELKDKL